ncbi:hypothetical protein C0995_013933 [Termitomyces sp. Mi166|nr:hypothetical protein C0995_013933 [Termitomyces sp. Mi166\
MPPVLHNSLFELSKLALMNFSQSHHDVIPRDLTLSWAKQDGMVATQTVKMVFTYKIHDSSSGKKRLGLVTVTNKLIPFKKQAAKLTTGALSMITDNMLDLHVNLLLVKFLFRKVLYQAAVHLSSLPPHPLYSPIHRVGG